MSNLKSNNQSIYSKNIINVKLNTYGTFRPKERTYRYCLKCGERLVEGSTDPFCNNNGWCRNEYYTEIAGDMDDIVGVN